MLHQFQNFTSLIFLLLPLHFCLFLTLLSAYTLPEKYFINCGSENSTVVDPGRVFVGDVQSPTSSSSFSPGKSEPIENIDLSHTTLPLYQTARVYRRSSSFTLNVDRFNRTYILRLHFFSFSPRLSQARFNVSTSYFSLLANFKPPNFRDRPVIEEFLLPIRKRRFSIRFTPLQQTLAFINGIEFFLAPENLIPDSGPHISPAGKQNPEFYGLLSMALHTRHRVNFGSLEVEPENDTLRRKWVIDDRFLYNPGAAKNSQVFSSEFLKYEPGIIDEFIAPPLVYTTAKEMNNQSNFSNITWGFDVSKNSRHLVRAHFCDIVSPVYNAIVFNFYIYSKYELRIDPHKKVERSGSPFYIDFVVDSDESEFLTVTVGPRTDSYTKNAFLNGLEIMELVHPNTASGKEKKRKQLFVIIGSVCAALAFIAIVIVVTVFLLIVKSKKSKIGKSSHDKLVENSLNLSILPDSSLGLRIPLFVIQQATRNFNEEQLIGEGGFGKVYKGNLRRMEVAIKRSESRHGQGLLEFQTEISVLSEIRYRHLVSLIGYCNERLEMILVYEFMENGTLRDHLYSESSNFRRSLIAPSKLSWKQRLEICIGAAKGLNYLHTSPNGAIIHRDVKSTNILLNRDFVAKVSDFGLSKPTHEANRDTFGIKGSFGYLDPEYFTSLQLTDKSDVYSFGVVLLEVLCARPAILETDLVQKEEINLAEWGMIWMKKKQVEKIMDPVLIGETNPNSLRKFAELVEKCLQGNGAERPSMHDVLWDLEYAFQLQEQSVVSKEQYEDSTMDVSLEFSVGADPQVQFLASDTFTIEEEERDAKVKYT